jgi:hypothetical protein
VIASSCIFQNWVSSRVDEKGVFVFCFIFHKEVLPSVAFDIITFYSKSIIADLSSIYLIQDDLKTLLQLPCL